MCICPLTLKSTYTEYSRYYFVFELEKAVLKKFVVIISLYFPFAMSEYLMSEYLLLLLLLLPVRSVLIVEC